MIYEIRDYHYLPEKFEAYKAWAKEAVPVLSELLDVVGFYVDDGTAPEATGTNPERPSIGYANVTWIIRWSSKAERDVKFAEAIRSPKWVDVWGRHPDADGYLQMLSRFVEEM